jgi:hypothetical protein
VSGTHAISQAPFLQTSLGPHWPQLFVRPPQPSASWPHVAPSLAHVAGVQTSVPHLPATPPPPHVWPFEHVPQFKRPPHPSPVEPQVTPAAAHVVGVHDGVMHAPSLQS